VKVFGIAGYSGMGKTTLLERLLPELRSRGLVVSLIKHSHKPIEIDRPGKDSYRHRGFLERAHGGTLFLDEVGELPPNMQAKLLRALQERCFFRLGAEKTTTSDFRVIAATNRDLLGRPWRGNARELRSHLEQAIVLSEAGILDVDAAGPADLPSGDEPDRPFAPLHQMVEEAERQHIRRALDRAGRSISATAALLGISRKTLWEKMKRLQIANEPGR
jgi:transcriptional regulator with PAS, ATPase and Fis domain